MMTKEHTIKKVQLTAAKESFDFYRGLIEASG
jgi:hypothetical protein